MKRYLITGASRGIGRAISVRLAEKGKLLLLHGRDKAALQKTYQLVRTKGGEAQVLIADLSSVKGVEKLLRQVGQKPIQVLVNNAGVVYVKPFSKITLSEWQENLAVNLSAPFLLIQKLLPQMNRGSTIVNILSVAARQGFRDWSSYCATKFALEGLSQCLREELRPKGIRVVNIYPKATGTGLWKKVSGKWPVDKMMEAEEVAEAVHYAITRPLHIQVDKIELGNVAGNL